MTILGSILLQAAGAAAAFGALASVAHGFKRDHAWARRARGALVAGFVCTGLAFAVLALSCITCDFRNAYVAAHTERALAPALRFAASWSGQEGSLLLWATMIAGVAALVGLRRRHIVHRGEPVTLAILSSLNLFFAALLLLAASPFVALPDPPLDGRGLHPELQHWAMILHPPIVFLGYSAFAAPLAITAGALFAGRSDNQWVAQIRRWSLFGWLCLGAGIALGGWWAYVELGWGGYWVWDAVENASLIPWLTAAALIHSIAVHQHRGMLKGWTAALGLGTFTLCIFGAFITRSGAVSSVHAFAKAGIGAAFGALALTLTLGAISLLLLRRRTLRPSAAIPSPAGREAATLAGNVLLTTMAALTIAGTSFPLISSFWSHPSLTLKRSFYDHAVAPLGLAVAALMALAPLLTYGRSAGAVLKRESLTPAVASLFAIAAALGYGVHHPVSLLCVAITVFAAAAMLLDWGRAVITQSRHTGFGLFETAARTMDNNHRRYGGQAAHLGFVLVVLGIVGSSIFSASTTATLTAGQSITVGRHTLRFEGVRQVQADTYTGAQASLVLTSSADPGRVLHPQQRLYGASPRPFSHVAVWTNLHDDLYVALLDWSRGGAQATIQARLNPLTIWIWIGAAVMTLASIYCLLPRLIPPPRDLAIDGPARREERPLHARRAGGA